MRSPVITFLLGLIAVVVCGLIGWQIKHGNLDVIFGAPPTAMGERLYPDLNPNEVKKISILSNGVTAEFVRDPQGWRMTRPWQDRMDPRAAEALIGFTQGTRVADVIPQEKIDPKQAGFKDGVVAMRMESASGQPLCKYLLGRKTAWLGELPPDPADGPTAKPVTVPTVFIRPLDKSRKSHIYACTGDVHPLFNDGFAYLRDHNPFLFRPDAVQRIRIRTSGGELTIGREVPGQAWRILKPLDLPTDPAALQSLIQGLINLRAVKVSDRSAVTLPTNGGTPGNDQIAIQMFGVQSETVLEMLPPQSADAATRLATVSDRPTAVFELPVKAQADLVALSSLPLKVNDLRSATLTNLNPNALKSILIQPTGRAPILISCEPRIWTVLGEEGEKPANERRIKDLLQLVLLTRVTNFVTDAATDFSQWGLDKPVLTLQFLGVDNQVLELLFGRDKAGACYVTRRGTTSVMRLEDSALSRVGMLRYQWRQALLWSVSRVDVRVIEILARGRPPVALKYSDKDEKWEATRGGRVETGDFEPARATKLLGTLEGLEVNRWLAPDDAAAASALADPSFVFRIGVVTTDDDGAEIGMEVKELRIAPAAEGTANRFYYGTVKSDPNPFLLDQETMDRLAVDLFGGD